MRRRQPPKPVNYEFDPVSHIGKADGVIWPSVTQLLQEFKLIDYSKVPDDRLEYKRMLGTRVHAATVLLDKGDLDEEDFNKNFPECVPYLEAYRQFRIIEQFEPIYKQQRYFSKKWMFHGEPDESGVHLGIYQGHLCITDYKCTWKMYASTGAQNSGYEILIREHAKELEIDPQLLKKPVLRFGLQLKETGHFQLTQFKDPNDAQDFKACLWLHWAKRNKYQTAKGITE